MKRPEEPERDKGGRFRPGTSGNPGGRAGQTQELRAQLAEGAEAVAKKVLAAAKKGDIQACRLVLERLVPPIKPTSEPVRFELDDTDLPATARSIMRAVAGGQLAPDQGKSLIDSLGAVARVIEVAELQKDIEELRRQIEGVPK